MPAMSSTPLFLLVLLQQSISSAALSGSIVDPSGAAMPGVVVKAVHIERNQAFEGTSDSAGLFRFLSLPVGEYRVEAIERGFSPDVRTLRLGLGQTVQLEIRLKVEAVASAIEVRVDQQAVDVVRSQASSLVLPAEIDSLPLNGRNFLDLALLVPGVSKTNTGNNERFAETSAVPGTGISVAGQRNLGNSFIVDGLSANDDAAELAGTFFSPEVISEFQVVTSGGIAEFGRSYGGVVNVATRSGANDWHGRVYGFLRNHRFDATHVFAVADPATSKRVKNPLTQAQYGASLSMPLKRNAAFLFANFEREDLNRSGQVTITPSNVALINSELDRIGYPAGRIRTGAYPTGDNRSNFFAKSDIQTVGGSRLALRFNAYDIASPNARGVGGLSDVSRGTAVDTLDWAAAANLVTPISGTRLNEFRFQFTRSQFKAPGNDLLGPAVSISGVANFGASTSSPTGRDTDTLEFADNYSLVHGAHSFKAGAAFIYNRVNIVFPASLFGTYSFSNLANFQAGNYTAFGQAFGKTDWFQTNPNIGWFVQEQWKVTRALTLNAGLRHDVQWLDASIQTRLGNFAPRVGLAYAPGAGKTILRASAGVYFDRIPLRAVANALRGAGLEYKTISLQRTQAGAPVFPNKLSGIPEGVLYGLSTIDPQIRNASSTQANLSIEREIGGGVSVSAGYLYVRGTHLIMNRNLNVPTRTAAQDPVNLGRPNPGFQNITQYSGQGDSYYNGLALAVDLRDSAWFGMRASYTLSKAIDNSGNAFFSAPQDNFNLRADRGLSDNDQRHRLSISGHVGVPRSMSGTLWSRLAGGFQLSPMLTVASAYPFNVLTGGQTLQTTAARPAGLGRNTGRGFASTTLDIRLSRRFRVSEQLEADVLVEAFNALNHTNLQFPNATFGSGSSPVATFGRATNAADPRQLQLGLRLSF
jgi:hypothetical protein